MCSGKRLWISMSPYCSGWGLCGIFRRLQREKSFTFSRHLNTEKTLSQSTLMFELCFVPTLHRSLGSEMGYMGFRCTANADSLKSQSRLESRAFAAGGFPHVSDKPWRGWSLLSILSLYMPSSSTSITHRLVTGICGFSLNQIIFVFNKLKMWSKHSESNQKNICQHVIQDTSLLISNLPNVFPGVDKTHRNTWKPSHKNCDIT